MSNKFKKLIFSKCIRWVVYALLLLSILDRNIYIVFCAFSCVALLIYLDCLDGLEEIINNDLTEHLQVFIGATRLNKEKINVN